MTLIYEPPPGTEADVSPRPNGDNKVSIGDWILLGRFAVALDTPALGSEFQRADCAPRGTRGDGTVSVADLVQAGRYTVGLDPIVPVGGPSAPVAAPAAVSPEAQDRILRVVNTNIQRGNVNSLTLELDAQGNENALAFSLNYDPKVLSFLDAKVNSNLGTATINLNDTQTANGRLGIVLVMPTGQVLPSGTRQLITLRYIPNGGDGTTQTTVSFSDQLVKREIVDANASPLSGTTYTNATLAVTGRAAAHVNAANYIGANLAADSIASAFGINLATITQGVATPTLPTILGGTTVKIKDSAGTERAAPLFFVSPSQINYQIPAGTVEGVATITITNGSGVATMGLANIGKVSPGLFSADTTGSGLAAANVVYVKPDNSQVVNTIARFDQALSRFVANPINVNVDPAYLILYGTGLRNRKDLASVKISIGGAIVPVEYTGAQGTFFGLDQINLKLPNTLKGRGEINLDVSVDGVPANTIKAVIQ